MEMSLTIGALAAALAKAQADMTHAKKDAANPFFRSKYADLASIMEAIRGPLTSNGIAVVQTTDIDDSGVIVETVLIHSSGEWISGRLRMPVVPKVDKETKSTYIDPQGVGSAISYGRRYGLQSMVSLPADDDDGNAASAHQATTAAKPALQRSPERPAPKAIVPTAADAPPATGTTGLMDPEQKKGIWGVWHTGLGWDMPKLERFVADTFDGKLIGGITKAEADQLLELLGEMMNMAAKEAK